MRLMSGRSNRRQEPKARAAPAESRVETIIRHIKLNIRNGGYAPGQRLIEADVQRLTGASRGPVREAMRRLGAEGLLEIHHQKGARVRRLTRSEVENLYDVREVIEGLAAHRAATHAKDPSFRNGLTALEKSFAKDFDGSPRSYMAYNERFHEFIVRRSGNAQLERLVAELQVPVFMLRLYSIIDHGVIEQAHAEHVEIVRYLLRGDGERAERAMRKHIRSTKLRVLRKAALLTP